MYCLNIGPGTHGTGFRGRLTQAEAKVLQHNTGPGTHGTGFRGRLTPAQAQAGGGKEERGRRRLRKKQNLNQGLRKNVFKYDIYRERDK